jgi:predicted TIM-barrel fold metal-dependent hydrolase
MIIDVHGHLLRDPNDLDWIAGSGRIDKVWLLAMPEMPAPYRPDANSVTFGTDPEVLEAAKSFPDFFLPFGFLDFRNPPEAIRDQREAGMVGLKAIFAEKPYDDPSYMAYYEQAESLRMPILFHLGGLGPIRARDLGPGLSTRAVNMRPSHLGTIAGNFPELVCVGAHMGQSWHGEVLECIRCYPNVYFDTSGGDTVLVMRWLLDHLGEPRVTDQIVTGIDSVYGRREYHEDILEKVQFWESFFKYAGHWFEWTNQAEKFLHGNAAAIQLPS